MRLQACGHPFAYQVSQPVEGDSFNRFTTVVFCSWCMGEIEGRRKEREDGKKLLLCGHRLANLEYAKERLRCVICEPDRTVRVTVVPSPTREGSTVRG